jgi:hypothetical protein
VADRDQARLVAERGGGRDDNPVHPAREGERGFAGHLRRRLEADAAPDPVQAIGRRHAAGALAVDRRQPLEGSAELCERRFACGKRRLVDRLRRNLFPK